MCTPRATSVSASAIFTRLQDCPIPTKPSRKGKEKGALPFQNALIFGRQHGLRQQRLHHELGLTVQLVAGAKLPEQLLDGALLRQAQGVAVEQLLRRRTGNC